MSLTKKILIIIICINLLACKSSQIIGDWHRTDLNPNNKNSHQGDLSIHSDSTFYVVGDSTNNQDTIPGWNTGEGYKGKWEENNRHLILWLEPKEEKLFLSFKIIRLTKNKLVLTTAFDEHNKNAYHLKYVRMCCINSKW